MKTGKLQEIHNLLMNLQPHIPQCCIKGKEGYIDIYVDSAMDKLQTLINDGFDNLITKEYNAKNK